MGLFDFVGELTGSSGAARDASAAQAAAAERANATQKEIYDQQRADSAQYRDAGGRALTQMEDPSFQKTFSMADFQADPGYQYRMDQANKALQASAAAKGGLFSGGFAKALQTNNQDMASQEYGNAYNRFNNDASTRFGRLSQIAGMGQTATQSTGQAAQNYGNNVSQNQIGVGNAQAAATIGANQAVGQMIGQTAGTAAMIFSDERLKKDIQSVSKADLNELRANLRALKFNYTHEVFGPTDGGFYGIMAQDLEKSKLGKTAVYEDEFGNKKIDQKRAVSLFLASMAEG